MFHKIDCAGNCFLVFVVSLLTLAPEPSAAACKNPPNAQQIECMAGYIPNFIATHPYVNFPVDGCPVRASDLIQGIVATCQYTPLEVWINATSPNILSPVQAVNPAVAGLSWWMHTTAKFCDVDGNWYVIDPAFSGGFIRQHTWWAALQATSDQQDFPKTTAAYPGKPASAPNKPTSEVFNRSAGCYYPCFGQANKDIVGCSGTVACIQNARARCAMCEAGCSNAGIGRIKPKDAPFYSCQNETILPDEGWQLKQYIGVIPAE